MIRQFTLSGRAFANGAIGHPIDSSLNNVSFQPVLYDWCNKDSGMCYPVCGMMHIKDLLLPVENISFFAFAIRMVLYHMSDVL